MIEQHLHGLGVAEAPCDREHRHVLVARVRVCAQREKKTTQRLEVAAANRELKRHTPLVVVQVGVGGEREISIPDRDVQRCEVVAVLYVQARVTVDRAEKSGVVAEVDARVEERVAVIVVDVHVLEASFGKHPEELERANSKDIASPVVLPGLAEADEAEGPARGSS